MKLSETMCPVCTKPMGDLTHSVRGDDSLPVTGDVGMCISCGSLLLWTGDSWRLSSQEERLSLLESEHVVHALTMQREYVAWQEADRERLTSICQVWLAAAHLCPQELLPTMVRDMTNNLISHGFHTHKLAGQ